MKKYALFILSMLLTTTFSFSQVLPYGFIPMEHNGSFAGMADEGRLTVNASLPLSTGSSGYGSYASYDKFFKSLNTGIGLTAYNSKYTRKYYGGRLVGGLLDSTQTFDKYESEDKASYIELAIAPKISIKGKYTISPSIKVNYGVINGLLLRGTDKIYDLDLKNINVTAGLAFNTSKYYIGYAVRVFEKEKFTFKSTDSYQYSPYKTVFYSVLEAGYSFSRKRNENSKFSFTPQLAIHTSAINGGLTISNIDLSLRFQYGRLLYGNTINSSSFSNLGSGVFLGWQQGGFRSLLILEDEGHLTLNFRYLIPNKNKKRSPVFW